MILWFTRLNEGTRKAMYTDDAAGTERKLRSLLRIANPRPGEVPHFCWHGEHTSVCTERMRRCFELADSGISDLSDTARAIEGMSGQKYRSFVNNYVRATDDAKYLEIGCWKGSTTVAVLAGNKVDVVCIDDWSQFGDSKDQFIQNVRRFLSTDNGLQLFERDFRDVEYGRIGKFNIVMLDGPHALIDHVEAVVLTHSAMTDPVLLIVDDWNWRDVRVGTFLGLKQARLEIHIAVEVRTSFDNTQPAKRGQVSDWHNGYLIALLRAA
jgi:Methyltransferase domain